MLYRQTFEVWQQIYSRFRSFHSRGVLFAVLGPDERESSGQPLAPMAHTCPGSPPTIYVTYTLAEKVFGERSYPESFMAFVLGHELGHRLSHLTEDGESFAVLESNDAREALADRRAAFLTTLAGYSTRDLAAQDVVDVFLANEVFVQQSDSSTAHRNQRREELVSALNKFSQFEHAYQLALTLSSTPLAEAELVARIIEGLDAALDAEQIALVEVKLVHSIVLMKIAAAHAPWMDNLGSAIPSAALLRCQALLPGQTMLADETIDGAATMGAGETVAQARQRALTYLKKADRLLDDATALGASPLQVLPIRACAAFYSAEPAKALDHIDRARQGAASHGGLSKTVLETLEFNWALIALQLYMHEHPRPSEVSEVETWQRSLAKHADVLRVGALAEFVADLLSPPTAPPSKQAPPRAALAALPFKLVLPDFEQLAGIEGCAAPLAEAGKLTLANSDAASDNAIFFCQRPASTGSELLVRAVYSSRTPHDTRIDVLRWHPGAPVLLASLEPACEALEQSFVTESGHRVLAGTCGALKDVIVYADETHVHRIDIVRRHW
ncbi:MAG: hypothetical protein H0U74_13485 [Bradymonadaceae bacterium]|nr:hypothetical protein [Lujinxingiaceae bacterium]